MLDIPPESITEIKISNPELTHETVASKFNRLDLSLKVDNKLVNVEIQVKTDTDYRDRTLFSMIDNLINEFNCSCFGAKSTKCVELAIVKLRKHERHIDIYHK